MIDAQLLFTYLAEAWVHDASLYKRKFEPHLKHLAFS